MCTVTITNTMIRSYCKTNALDDKFVDDNNIATGEEKKVTFVFWSNKYICFVYCKFEAIYKYLDGFRLEIYGKGCKYMTS